MESEQVKMFFNEYEQRFNESLQGTFPDIEGIRNAFAAYFVEGSPAGIICSKNDEKFKESIPLGLEFYKSIGTKSMLIKFIEVTKLDDLYSMAKVHWRATYLQNDKEKALEFEVFYFLQTVGDAIKIFAYITGDEEQALKDNGLIPN